MSFINTKKLQKQQVRNATKVTPPRPAVYSTADINTMSLDELRNAYRQLQQLAQQQQATARNFTPSTDGLLYNATVTVDNILPLPLNNGETSALAYFNADMVCEFANDEFSLWLPKGILSAQGKHHKQLVGDAIFVQILPYIQQALQGRQTQFERQGLVEQKYNGWVRVQYIPKLSNGGVIGYYTILTNITAVKKMEADLAFEHANTLALINNTTDYIWSFGHDLKLISANKPYQLLIEKLGGHTFAIGMDVLPPAHFLPKGTNRLLENCRRVLAGETFITEDQLVIDQLGVEIFLETSFCPIIEQGKVVAAAAFSRDITARKKEMERLKLLESAITHTKDIVMITKAEPFGEPGPIIEYVNPAFTAITGYTAEEAIGKSPRFLQGPGTDRQQLKNLRACMEKWQPGEVTTLNYKKSGEPFWVNFSVHPVANEKGWFTHWVSVEKDVTAQKNAEQALLNSLKHLENYTQAVEKGTNMVIFNLAGVITFANDRFCQLSKYTKEELVGSHMMLLPSDQITPEYGLHFWKTVMAGNVFRDRMKKTAKDGSYFWVDAILTPFVNTEGEVYQVLALDTDITQTKLAEEALQLSNDRFNLAAKATLDIIWDWDIAKKEMYYSDACETLLGYRGGMHPFDLQPKYFTQTHPDDVTAVIKSMQLALSNGSMNWQHQYKLKNLGGEYATIIDRALIIRDEQGLAVRMVGAMQDVTVQTLAEKALTETNRLLTDYKQALDEANMVFIADADGIIKYANNNLRQMSGYTKAELIGSHISIIKSWHHSDAYYNHVWQTILMGKVFKAQIKNRAKNGSYYWVDTTITPFLNTNGKVYQFLVIDTDITQTKLAEEALQASNQRFNLAIEATMDVIWDWDIAKGQIFLSDAFLSNFGHDAGWHPFALTPAFFEKRHPDDAPGVLASLQIAIKGNDIFWQHQYRLRKQNGEYAHITDRAIIVRDEHGTAIRMVGAKRDITEQVQNAQKERAQELRFREMVYNVNDVINIIDEKGIVLYSSPSLKTVAGFEPNEVVGLKTFALAHPEDYATLKQNHAALLQHPGNGQVVEVRYRHKNGHYINIEIQGNNQLHNPAIKGIVLTTRDVTARNQKETERRELLYELMRKNTDLRQFSYLAGHHLRAPLTNLSAICTLLDADGLAPDEVPMLLNAFKTSTLKINEVLDDIIKILLVKDSAPKQVKDTVHLQQALAVAMQLTKNAIAASGATVTADFSNAPQVMFSKAYMQDIFAELITNAIQFAHSQRPPVITITVTTTGGTVVVTVADNGLGLDMEKAKNKVFGLYQRFTNIGTGRGLGLYMVQAKLAMFGYTIAVQSTVNKGSTFTIRLHNQQAKS